MKETRLLIMGGSGFIGARLVQSAAATGYKNLAYTYAHKEISLPAIKYQITLDQPDASLTDCLAAFVPEVVVYSAVPLPLNEAQQAPVNIDGVRRTLDALKKISPHALFVYVSTNTVFGGGRGLYREDETPDAELRRDPYFAYGTTKAAGEKLALESWPNTLIARTCVVDGYAYDGKLSPRLANLAAKLQAGETLIRFGDRYFSPTLVDDVVDGILETIEPGFSYRGVLHLAGRERITDYEYGRKLARCLKIAENCIKMENMADSPTMAAGPRDNSFDVRFTQSLLRTTRLRNVEEQLDFLFHRENLLKDEN